MTSEAFFKKICTSHFIVKVRKGLLKVLLWEGVGDWTKTAICWPPLLWPSALCLSCSPVLLNRRPRGPLCWVRAFSTASCHQLVSKLHRESRGPLLLGGDFPYHILSPTRLISNSSDLQLVWSSTPSGAPRAPSAGRWLSLPHLLSDFPGPQLTDFLSSPSYIIVQSPTQSPTQSLEWHVWSSSSGNNCHAVQRSLSSGASVYECIMGFYLVPFRQPNPPTRFLSITGHWNVSLPSGASLWNGMFGRVEGQYTKH